MWISLQDSRDVHGELPLNNQIVIFCSADFSTFFCIRENHSRYGMITGGSRSRTRSRIQNTSPSPTVLRPLPVTQGNALPRIGRCVPRRNPDPHFCLRFLSATRRVLIVRPRYFPGARPDKLVGSWEGAEKDARKGSEDHRISQNAVNSEFKENSNQIPEKLHNISPDLIVVCCHDNKTKR
jgi:hypothetical protein